MGTLIDSEVLTRKLVERFKGLSSGSQNVKGENERVNAYRAVGITDAINVVAELVSACNQERAEVTQTRSAKKPNNKKPPVVASATPSGKTHEKE